jgi:hypothetical protein
MARSGYNVKIDTKGQLRKLERAFADANNELEQAIVGEITSPVWDWPGTTLRKSGEVAGSPRDIVDERTLLDSYRVEKRGARQMAHVFEADHALPVHNGAVLRNGGIIRPRPFTERPARDFPQMFVRVYRSLS